MHVGVARFELVELRAAADDDLSAGQIEIEEGLDALLGGDAPDIEKDRAGAEKTYGARAE